jgi:hypothetical protein
MSDQLEQAQIQFSAQIAALHTKVKALKKFLTKEQLELYNQSVLKDKEKFLSNHSNATSETLKKIDIAFS